MIPLRALAATLDGRGAFWPAENAGWTPLLVAVSPKGTGRYPIANSCSIPIAVNFDARLPWHSARPCRSP